MAEHGRRWMMRSVRKEEEAWVERRARCVEEKGSEGRVKEGVKEERG